MPRELVQHADDLSKLEDRHDFGFTCAWRRRVLDELGPSAREHLIDRFAAPHNAVSALYNALFDAPGVEAVGAFSQDWCDGLSYLLPPVTKIDAVLDKIERDNAAAAVLVVPVWTRRGWWRRLASGAWEDRVAARLGLPPSALVAHPENAEHGFFGTAFGSQLLALRIVPRRNGPLRERDH